VAFGILLVLNATVDDTRTHNLAVLRDIILGLRHVDSINFASLPLPAEYRDKPPDSLRTSWAANAGGRSPYEFELRRFTIPLTNKMMSDNGDPDDAHKLFGDASASGDQVSSTLYRAEVPFQSLLPPSCDPDSWRLELADACNNPRGVLRVWLPNGRVHLWHDLDLVKWHPTKINEETLAGCQAASGIWIPHDAGIASHEQTLQGFCSQRRLLARLCYAVHPDDATDGSGAFDCEFGHRSPLYEAPSLHDTNRTVEIILRARNDIYVRMSQVTSGCSSCFGYAYGENDTSTSRLACGAGAEAWKPWHIFDPKPSPGNCLGLPPRYGQASGCLLVSVGLGLLLVATDLIDAWAFFGKNIFRNSVVVRRWLLRLAAVLFLAAAGRATGLMGMLSHQVNL
jgi:hypothetical protein